MTGTAWRHIAHKMECAKAALSPREMKAHLDQLHAVAPNPFEQGRANQEAMWQSGVEAEARKMVWC